MGAQVGKAIGKLTKYWFEHHNRGIAKSMIEGSTTLEEQQMFQVELVEMKKEQTVDFNFNDKFCIDYKITSDHSTISSVQCSC